LELELEYEVEKDKKLEKHRHFIVYNKDAKDEKSLYTGINIQSKIKT